jgi:hypothetical protein
MAVVTLSTRVDSVERVVTQHAVEAKSIVSRLTKYIFSVNSNCASYSDKVPVDSLEWRVTYAYDVRSGHRNIAAVHYPER